MSLANTIMEFPAKVSSDYVSEAIQSYTRAKTPRQIRRELNSLSDPDLLSEKIKECRLEYIVFTAATGIEAQEQITYGQNCNIVGYEHLGKLARLLSGKRISKPETGTLFKKLADKHNMPKLTKDHRAYVDNFTAKYVEKISRKRLKEEIAIGFTSSEKNPKYSLFLQEISEKISQDSDLQYALFVKLTGIRAQEEIIHDKKLKKPGYTSLRGIVKFLTGKRMNVAETGNFFKALAKSHNMPQLTKVNRKYMAAFGLEYVQKTSREELYERIPIGRNSISPTTKRHSIFLAELSKKISQDPILRYEFLKKCTGISKEKQVRFRKKHSIPGYMSLTGLTNFLFNRLMSVKEVSRSLRELVQKYENQPVIGN